VELCARQSSLGKKKILRIVQNEEDSEDALGKDGSQFFCDIGQVLGQARDRDDPTGNPLLMTALSTEDCRLRDCAAVAGNRNGLHLSFVGGSANPLAVNRRVVVSSSTGDQSLKDLPF
jgi:hypothetical protein